MNRGRRARMLAAAAAAVVSGLLAAPAALGAAQGPSLAVAAGADWHPISPNIYGLNFAPAGLANELDLPVDRWGGNTTDTYNWKIGASNTGNDYFFENIPDCFDPPTYDCSHGPRFGYKQFICACPCTTRARSRRPSRTARSAHGRF